MAAFIARPKGLKFGGENQEERSLFGRRSISRSVDSMRPAKRLRIAASSSSDTGIEFNIETPPSSTDQETSPCQDRIKEVVSRPVKVQNADAGSSSGQNSSHEKSRPPPSGEIEEFQFLHSSPAFQDQKFSIQKLPDTRERIYFTEHGLDQQDIDVYNKIHSNLEAVLPHALSSSETPQEPAMFLIQLVKAGKRINDLQPTILISCSRGSHKEKTKKTLKNKNLDLLANWHGRVKVLVVSTIRLIMDVRVDGDSEGAKGKLEETSQVSWEVEGRVAEHQKATQQSLCGTALRFVAGTPHLEQVFIRKATAGGLILVKNQARLLTVSHPMEPLGTELSAATLRDDLPEAHDDNSLSGWSSDSSDALWNSHTRQRKDDGNRTDSMKVSRRGSNQLIRVDGNGMIPNR